MLVQCYVCVRPQHPAIKKLVVEDGGSTPPHITILPPFVLKEPETVLYRAEAVTNAAHEIAGVLSPFSVRFFRIRTHQNADKNSRVVSLKPEPNMSLELIRQHLVKELGEYINPKYLFPFHLTLAKKLTNAEARRIKRQTVKVFQPFEAEVKTITTYWREVGDKCWHLLNDRVLRAPAG